MKKLSAILLAVSALSQLAWAQDTLKLCTYPYPYATPLLADQLCPQGYNQDDLRVLYNGQTFNLGEALNLGEAGWIDVYCDDGNFLTIDSTIDATFFVQTVGIPQICIVTSDSNDHSVIYIDSSTLFGNDTVHLLRQVTTSAWQTVASFTLTDPLVITDTTANMALQAYTYSIRSADCPNSHNHTTIHLQSTGGNLSWNPYSYSSYWLPFDTNAPPPLQGYYIYKRIGSGSFILIDSTIGSSYTDLNFQPGVEYFVEAIKLDGCNSNSWQKTNAPVSVMSNRLNVGTSDAGQPEQRLLKYFVEGSTLFVELKKENDVWVHDLLGRELLRVHAKKVSIPLNPGMYIVSTGQKGYKVLIR